MDLYVILRRDGWRSAEELQEAAARSTAEGEKMPDDIAWIRSYVLEEGSGLGTVCIYQASSPEAVHAHAAAAGLPVTEVIKVVDTVTLDGTFTFDALSPDGRQMYLIEYTSPRDLTQYLVREYDLERDRLLSEPIVDPNESGEEMAGFPQMLAGMVRAPLFSGPTFWSPTRVFICTSAG